MLLKDNLSFSLYGLLGELNFIILVVWGGYHKIKMT